jgi:hypothetical protein
MTRTTTPEPDVDEWSCNQCARRLLIRRPPEFEKVVLESGDEWAAHIGGSGGLEVSAMTASPAGGGAESGALPRQDRAWLAAHGINWEHPADPLDH